MNHSNRLRLSKLSIGLIVALAAAPAFAQNTTAGLSGQVVGADGQPVVGAEVTILHTESGTVSRVVTDGNGRYSARGLRVGGPYKVTANKEGAGTQTESDVYLALDQVSQIDIAIGGQELDTISVIGSAGPTVFSPDKMGAGTAISRQDLDNYASVQRNLQDYVRFDPRISQTDKERGEISAGGHNLPTTHSAGAFRTPSPGDSLCWTWMKPANNSSLSSAPKPTGSGKPGRSKILMAANRLNGFLQH